MIKFSAARLAKEPIELDGFEPAEFLDIEPSELLAVDAPVEYHLLVKAVSGGALIHGSVSTILKGLCGRCLAPVRRELKAGELCIFREIGNNEEEIDISEDVRAELLLEMPMNLLCSENCRGLCPVCGANRNTTKCNCSAQPANPGCWDALDDLKL